MEKGYLTLVLHAHLPFVRHPESENYLEERWLFEAITETYIPLLQVFQGLVRDQVDFRMTMSLSPTLISMLTDDLLQKRYLTHMNRLIELAEQEVVRTAGMEEFHPLAVEYLHKFKSARQFYLQYGGNLIKAFRELQALGKLEIITSCATHSFLPLVYTEEAIRAQIQTAVDLYIKNFGRSPKGIWLPECGFAPKADPILKECGIEYFFVDSHGMEAADPAPIFGTLSPVLTPNGVAAFARDTDCSKQVWSSQEGYPGDYDYREYYRDIGYDLNFETVEPYLHPPGIRMNTGIKYYRITEKGEYKEPYNPHWAREKAARHAGHFLHNRQKQVEHFSWHMGRKPIVVAPYDAELFGHWWYEGPLWIDMLLRKIYFDQTTIELITPSEYLRLYSDYQMCRLTMSSWGRNGYGDVWLRGENDWIYPALHEAEKRMIELANQFQGPAPDQQRALNQAGRELMLAESSDWAFIMDGKTMVDYAVKRTKFHINRFSQLYEMLQTGQIDRQWLDCVEQIDSIFPDFDYRTYQSRYPMKRYSPLTEKPCVLMLSWEFPPMTVGGLARHIYDLSRYLVRNGWEVHVLTTEIAGYPHTEVVEGVHVHRVHVLKPDGQEFIHWAFQLNLMMIDACQALIDSGLKFDLIHAHDWLVCYAAKTIKQLYNLPLVATIHATEHGRNNGIHTDLQRYICSLEWKLTYEASQVILCSQFMKQEVKTLFQLPEDKLHVIPNGVDSDLLQCHGNQAAGKFPYALDHEQIVLFIGRLVREKGGHTFLQAVPSILAECPHAKFVIAGKGPAREDLERLAKELAIEEKVVFTGFVQDETRNRLYQIADVAVFPSLYEPFGIVALEAMAAGTPVVASDIGGLADVVQHGRNGLKMYPGDVQSLATQVKQVLLNPEYASQLAVTALMEMNRFDWNHLAKQTIKVYRDALEWEEDPKDSNDYGGENRDLIGFSGSRSATN